MDQQPRLDARVALIEGSLRRVRAGGKRGAARAGDRQREPLAETAA
jgi:hypothetical protein